MNSIDHRLSATNSKALGFALLAAFLYAISTPVSKILLNTISPTMLAAFLYLGAGMGMVVLGSIRKLACPEHQAEGLTREQMPAILAMIGLDIAAPILLMLGLNLTNAATVALLNNFEIVATAVLALVFFHERIPRGLWAGIGLITLASLLLSAEDAGTICLNPGALLVLLACCCWGLENNCTRVLSRKDPLQIVMVKGFGSGTGAFVIALAIGESLPALSLIPLVLLLGFVAYGLSIFCYVSAQRDLGAARTSACYAITPFVSAGLSLILFSNVPGPSFFIALGLMILGTFLATKKTS